MVLNLILFFFRTADLWNNFLSGNERTNYENDAKIFQLANLNLPKEMLDANLPGIVITGYQAADRQFASDLKIRVAIEKEKRQLNLSDNEWENKLITRRHLLGAPYVSNKSI